MTVQTLLQEVDTEIAKWKKLRSSIEAIFQTKQKPRHRHVRSQVTVRKRHLSKAGRARIIAAAKKRWAAAKKAKKAAK